MKSQKIAVTDWNLGIHDTTATAYAIMAGYLVAAVLCLFAAREHWIRWVDTRWTGALFWVVMSGVLVVLGANKPLDIQTLIIQLGKTVARTFDIYEYKNILIGLFVTVFAIGATGTIIVLLAFGRRATSQRWLLRGALGLLGLYVVLRAASVLHADRYLHLPLPPYSIYWLLEPAGVALLVVAAWLTTAGRDPESWEDETVH